MKRFSSLALALIVLAGLTSSVRATVIIDDTWADAIYTNWNLPYRVTLVLARHAGQFQLHRGGSGFPDSHQLFERGDQDHLFLDVLHHQRPPVDRPDARWGNQHHQRYDQHFVRLPGGHPGGTDAQVHFEVSAGWLHHGHCFEGPAVRTNELRPCRPRPAHPEHGQHQQERHQCHRLHARGPRHGNHHRQCVFVPGPHQHESDQRRQ